MKVIVSRLKLKNWRNFREVDVPLRKRQFIVGPNASGKSNLLDVFCFLRDIAVKKGGGLQKAIEDRGGLPKLRYLNARRDPEISIEIHLADFRDAETPLWKYIVAFKQEPRGYREPVLTSEKVWSKEKDWILERPNEQDQQDDYRLKQTFLEQFNNNEDFREVFRYLNKVSYLHLVPQLLKYANHFRGDGFQGDPFGQNFLMEVAKMKERFRSRRMEKIQKALRSVVPQLTELKFEQDELTGRPHVTARYSHWRKGAGWQREDQFSDGTLRLIGFLWSLLESGDSLTLLEEPEQSLHAEIIGRLGPLIYRAQKTRQRQVLVSTHSERLLSDGGIDGREVLLLEPSDQGTEVQVAGTKKHIKALLEGGLPVGEVAIAQTKPRDADQLFLPF